MIAEDDAAILESMKIILEDSGYIVEGTNDGKEVLSQNGELPDILLLDIWLSGTDGKVICKELKSNERTKHMPIIICSANRDARQISLDAGADDFLAKPFDMDELLKKIEMYTKSAN